MDGDFRLDIEEIINNIETAEVISLFFPLIRKTLLLDTRCDIEDGPMVKVVPMVDSVEDRFKALKRMRPRLPRPENITVIPWPKYVSSLKRLGIWDKIIGRMLLAGSKEAVEMCDKCYQDLMELDNAELAAVINGDHYYTLWEARR